MTTKQLRQWVDAEGAEEVARICGVGIQTIARWAIGLRIPKTRRAVIDAAYKSWRKARATS